MLPTGGEWCWDIHLRYFSAAVGILDWYHASEHLWEAARTLHPDRSEAARAWVDQAQAVLRDQGGSGLLEWLQPQRAPTRRKKRAALDDLIRYVSRPVPLMDYPTYRRHDWQIGTGMMEATCKQLVGTRLKGPGMHWSEAGALSVTALRAQSLNHNWHSFWNNLVMAT